MSRGLRVLRVGGPALIEDAGRPGLAGIGVGSSGAADRAAYRLANRLLANPAGSAAIEVTLGGLEVAVEDGMLWCCVTGAPLPVTIDGREVGAGVVAAARPGSVIRLGSPRVGLRSYLAIRGGIDLPAVLGSRSHDVLSGLGPPPVRPGDLLPVGPAPDEQPEVDLVPLVSPTSPAVLRLTPGPRSEHVHGLARLVETRWRVSEQSDRVGTRLDGGRLEPAVQAPVLPSEGAWRGAIQMPPSGQPVVFGPDHPVTGGYPVVAVVLDADVDLLAQLRPGEEVRLRWA